jgi:hypothetical protein
MCHFVTLIVPTDNAAAVRSVMERHGRAATPVDNPSLRRVLVEGERQYLTSGRYCDCGTVLVPHRDTPEEELVEETIRLRRRGWSSRRIGRAIEDRRKVHARPLGDRPDSFELWNAVLRNLGNELRLPYAGLFVRFYWDAVATETFNASRRQLAKHAFREHVLSPIRPDQATIFPLH